MGSSNPSKTKMDIEVNIKEFRPLDPDQKNLMSKAANTIRELAMDATQKANSGHPGMPMGCAEIGAYLYGYALNHNPKDPKWMNRDRLILSGGHGSMWLYACLHLAGFNLPMDEIKNFRQLHSHTPGHPEDSTPGVETTTGPLGQGVGNGVGQALGLKILGARFNTPQHTLIDSKVFVVMTDGDMMEGVASEASALAAHWKLNNLIMLYDANKISLDGPLSDSSSEDTKKRYQAYGWDVYQVDGHNLDELHATISQARTNQERPVLIICTTIIGKGAPNKAGTHKVHGSPLGEEEVKAAKAALGLSEESFYVPQTVYEFFNAKAKQGASKEEEWKKTFDAWAKVNPQLHNDFQTMSKRKAPEDIERILWEIEIKSPIAGRNASHTIIQKLSEVLPYLYGGSADLSCSDMTLIDKRQIITPPTYEGRNLKFGVREFGMATIATGLDHTKMILPFIGTFLTFSDYMRNAIRLCALMKGHVIYHFTHDSIFLGEDGPTHQPIEHLAALRAMPNLQVIRPADANEVRMAWVAALNYKGPTAFVFSRQNLPTLENTKVPYAQGLGRGAYILQKESRKPDYMLVATGSEVSLALDVAVQLEKRGKAVRVVSMPCWELFEQQNSEYQDSIFGGDLGKRVSIEAGVELGWHKYIGSNGIPICMESFGASAPQKALAEEFGFTVDLILERIL
jgi:transketolase